MQVKLLIVTLVALVAAASSAGAQPLERDLVLANAITGRIVASPKLAQEYSTLGDLLGNKHKLIEDEADVYETIASSAKLIAEWDSTPPLFRAMKPEPPREAIKQFSALSRAIIQCNFESYLNLAQNYAAAFAESEAIPRRAATNQVKSSILAAIEAHRDQCMPEYHQRFQEQISQMDGRLIDHLKGLFNGELLDEIFSPTSRDLKSALQSKHVCWARFKGHWAGALLQRLAALSEGSEDAKYIKSIPSQAPLESEFQRRIVKKLILEPCQSYVHELSDILEPAKIDLATNVDQLIKMDPEHSYILRDAWKRYLVCGWIGSNQESFSRELAEQARKRFS